jgi:hypothetical protein
VPAHFDPRRYPVRQTPHAHRPVQGVLVPSSPRDYQAQPGSHAWGRPGPIEWTPPPVRVIVLQALPQADEPDDWGAFEPWEAPVPRADMATASAVEGDILCDAAGRLYERRRSRVRPIFESQTPAPPTGAARTGLRPVTDPSAGRRWLRWGEFGDLLAPQLAHPERLRASHLLPCDVHVFEAIGDQPFEPALRAASGARPGSAVLRLTTELAVRLSLEAIYLQEGARPDGLLRSGERLVRIDLADDPTAETAGPAPVAPAALPPPGPRPGVPAASSAPGAGAPTLKRAVPPALERPWEYRVSREEAIWHAQRDASRPLAWWRRLLARMRHRADRLRWRTLISARTPDEQLWSVRPPDGAWLDRDVREWARQTLSAAGYDAGAMLFEWELFWRRKGC